VAIVAVCSTAEQSHVAHLGDIDGLGIG
jgi:hypothetical protein